MSRTKLVLEQPNEYKRTGRNIQVTKDELLEYALAKLQKFDRMPYGTKNMPNPYTERIIANLHNGKSVEIPVDIQQEAIQIWSMTGRYTNLANSDEQNKHNVNAVRGSHARFHRNRNTYPRRAGKSVPISPYGDLPRDYEIFSKQTVQMGGSNNEMQYADDAQYSIQSNDVRGRSSNDVRGRSSNDLRGRSSNDVRGRSSNQQIPTRANGMRRGGLKGSAETREHFQQGRRVRFANPNENRTKNPQNIEHMDQMSMDDELDSVNWRVDMPNPEQNPSMLFDGYQRGGCETGACATPQYRTSRDMPLQMMSAEEEQEQEQEQEDEWENEDPEYDDTTPIDDDEIDPDMNLDHDLDQNEVIDADVVEHMKGYDQSNLMWYFIILLMFVVIFQIYLNKMYQRPFVLNA
jgi:hypothetical protein